MVSNYKVTMSEQQYDDYIRYLTAAPNVCDVKKPRKSEFGEDNIHPTLKPVKLMEWLIKLTTNENDVVLDCFAGSGTTLAACEALNRTGVGIELSKEYLPIIKSRAPDSIIMNGDCIEVMAKMDANSVDAVICDPPYNIKMAGWDAYESDEAFGLWIREWGKEAFRVLRPGGVIVAFSAARTYHYLAYNLDHSGFKCRDMLEWVYFASMPKGKNLKQCHEPIYVGWKSERSLENFTFNVDACRIPVKEKVKKGSPVTTVTINGLQMEVEGD